MVPCAGIGIRKYALIPPVPMRFISTDLLLGSLPLPCPSRLKSSTLLQSLSLSLSFSFSFSLLICFLRLFWPSLSFVYSSQFYSYVIVAYEIISHFSHCFLFHTVSMFSLHSCLPSSVFILLCLSGYRV